MNRSATNIRMVTVLLGALVIALLVVPEEVGALFEQFGQVVADAGRQMHNGYMRLFD